MARRLVVMALVAMLAGVVAPAAGAQKRGDGNSQRAQASRKCQQVILSGRAYVLYYQRMSCRSARRRVRRVRRDKYLAGWECSSGSGYRSGGYCSRGRQLFGWHPYD